MLGHGQAMTVTLPGHKVAFREVPLQQLRIPLIA